jgi:hypothetical protein
MRRFSFWYNNYRDFPGTGFPSFLRLITHADTQRTPALISSLCIYAIDHALWVICEVLHSKQGGRAVLGAKSGADEETGATGIICTALRKYSCEYNTKSQNTLLGCKNPKQIACI